MCIMKVYKVILSIIDHDELGSEEIKGVLEDTKYPNWCIAPRVHDIKGVDIGEWNDDHPLNHIATEKTEFERLFLGI